YLDGELIHDTSAPSQQKFFSASGRDSGDGDVIVKAINLGEDKISATVKLSGTPIIPKVGSLTVLESPNLSDNNSLEQPTKITPRESLLQSVGTNFPHEFPPHSLSILRLKTSNQ